LDDAEIVNILKTENYNVARRTVVKYRQELNIPASRYRRVYTK
jgi:RNA polymerase sigma-54 factor